MSTPRSPAPGRVLVLGATGYVGGRLVPRLLEAGWTVRCLARDPAKLSAPWAGQAEIVAGDLLAGSESLEAAFAGVDAVVHLVHSMGSADDFGAADRRIAATVARCAAEAGVRRIVYLGGLGEVGERTSAHLRSRAEVAEVLAAGPVPVTVLRAAVIIGSGSASFEMLRHLVEKLPVMIVPRWVHTRVQPVAIRDVLRCLVGVLEERGDASHTFDLGGPDVLTYLEMMQRYARIAGLRRRLVLPVPLLSPKLSSHWVNLVTPIPFGLAKPLVLSLSNEVVVRPDGEDVTELVPGRFLGFDEAVRLALTRVRDRGVVTSWRDAGPTGGNPAAPYPGDPAWSGGTLLSDERQAASDADPARVFTMLCGIGGERGWPSSRWAWWTRGLLDRLVGGVGLRRGRRDPDDLRVGDALDFWRVEALQRPAAGAAGVLRLRAEMRLPGRAWLEFRVEPGQGGGSVLRQRALFAPRGLAGRAYWWALVPFHRLVFGSMVTELARRAARAPDVTAARAAEDTPGA